MTWHANIEDFGEEVQPFSTFRFECHPGLKCFGTCCATAVTLTPFDIARLRRHMAMDSHQFLSSYCQTFVDPITGFPSVLLVKGEDGMCFFSSEGSCQVYENRPSCCRYYPLAQTVENDGKGAGRVTKYYLQRRAHYCEGMGRGPEWTAETYCDENGLGPYEKANDVFLEVPFAFEMIPLSLRHDKEVQTMIYQAAFDFDTFLKKYAPSNPSLPPEDDHQMIDLLSSITLNLIRRTAELESKE